MVQEISLSNNRIFLYCMGPAIQKVLEAIGRIVAHFVHNRYERKASVTEVISKIGVTIEL